MSKVGNKSYADGWQQQGKSVSQKMAETRSVSSQKEIGQASKIMERARAAMTKRPERPQTNVQAREKVHVESGASRPQTFEKARPETQDRAAQLGNKANSEFVKNKQDATNLKNLQSKASVSSKMTSEPATPKAVVQKGTANQPNLGRQQVEQPAARLAKSANDIARMNDARARAASQLSKTARQTQKGGPKNAGQNTPKPAAETKVAKNAAEQADAGAKIAAPHAAGAQAAKTADRPNATEKKETGERRSEKREGASASSKGVAHAGGSNASRDLNAMLGGFGGGGDTGNMDAEGETGLTPVCDSERKDALPESDPSLHVYSEFDSEKPGVEMVKSKAQLFSRHVEKRLSEIARLDSDLDGRIENMFKNTPLSERIVGDLKDEIKLASLLGSVYGGGFRG